MMFWKAALPVLLLLVAGRVAGQKLHHAIPGPWPSSPALEPELFLQTGRFITWMTMPTEEAMAAIERGESDPGRRPNHYDPIHRTTNETRESGSGDTFLGCHPHERRSGRI